MLFFCIISQNGTIVYDDGSVLHILPVLFLLLFTHHYPETYKPKFHCRRQSGMNFGYVTVNGVNSNLLLLFLLFIKDYIIPIPGLAAGAGVSSLMIATADSVVSNVDATLVAF